MNKKLFGALAVTAVAGLFSANIALADHHEGKTEAKGTCLNGCKGKSECKAGGKDGCKGHNECKGKGWVKAADAKECKAAGGKWKKG